MEKYCITISRQFASLGRSIAQKMSEDLDIEFYDRDIVEATAKRMGESVHVISKEEENANIKFFRRKYPLGMGVANIQDVIFEVEKNIVRDVAAKESCIVVGRCGNCILSDYDRVIHIYIYASYEERYKNCVDVLKMKPKNAKKMIREVDKARDNYRKRYCDHTETMFDGYDIMIDSSRFGVDGTAKVLEDIVRKEFF